jgi:nitroreductase
VLLAREHGLHTCPQEAWAVWHRIIREYLNVPENEMVFCGVAIGYADEAHPVNSLHSDRAPLEEFVTFKDGV